MLLITFQVLNTEVSGPKVNSAGGRGLCPRLIWATKFCETPEKDTPSLLREPQKHVPFSPGMKEGPSHRLDPVPMPNSERARPSRGGPGRDTARPHPTPGPHPRSRRVSRRTRPQRLGLVLLPAQSF